MIIMGFLLVVFGLVTSTQELWAVGAILIAAGAALSLFGTTGPRYRGRSFYWG